MGLVLTVVNRQNNEKLALAFEKIILNNAFPQTLQHLPFSAHKKAELLRHQ